MNPPPLSNLYQRHRFPAEIISHCVWLYFRFCLSYRDVEALMAERGVSLTYEAVRYWCRKFGQVYANQLRHRQPRGPGGRRRRGRRHRHDYCRVDQAGGGQIRPQGLPSMQRPRVNQRCRQG